MTRSLFALRVVVKDDERAILSRNGRFERMLDPGRHVLFDPARALAVEAFNVVRTEFPADRYDVLAKSHPDVAARYFAPATTRAFEVAIVSFDGQPTSVLPPFSRRVYWKAVNAVEIDRVDTRDALRVDKAHAERIDFTRSSIATQAIVEQHEAALLFVNGELVERLKPGRHEFWKTDREVKVVKIDMRPQPIEITAQEILTKDRIALRITLTAFYRVVDPEKSAAATSDLSTMLYRLVQFAIREAVATRTLDEILAARDAIDAELRAYVGARTGDLGVSVAELGVKDVILPGEVRDLVNKVVEAERLAKANLIRRQEETAATRSLLNTAKLMEANPLLVRLKELEALEKLVEKVGRIDLHAGEGKGLDALLSGLYRLGGSDAERPAS
ncbi:MAG: slipin family protein [Rhizobiales bacterium]|nr:slipin family protein [Hyphomicrobiales bacterium]